VTALYSELEFLKSLWGLGTEEEEGYRTGPPGYIGWRNSFLGIDPGAPYTFKNKSSLHTTYITVSLQYINLQPSKWEANTTYNLYFSPILSGSLEGLLIYC
jgi:hypothetical protein